MILFQFSRSTVGYIFPISSSDQQPVRSSPLSRAAAVPQPPPFLLTASSHQLQSLSASDMWGQEQMIGSQATSAAQLPETLGLVIVADFSSSVQDLTESVDNMVSVSPPRSAQLAPPEPARFFQETKDDQVYLPAEVRGSRPTFTKPPLHPNRANDTGSVTGPPNSRPIEANLARGEAGFTGVPIGGNGAFGKEEPNQAGCASNFWSEIHLQVSGQSIKTSFQTLFSQSSYYSLLNRVSLLCHTQIRLEETIFHMESHYMDLNGRVIYTNQKTAESVQAQELAVAQTFKTLFGRIDNCEKRGAKIQAKRALLERKITKLDEKNRNLELELGRKREEMKKTKEEVERRGRILNYCSCGLVLGVLVVLFK